MASENARAMLHDALDPCDALSVSGNDSAAMPSRAGNAGSLGLPFAGQICWHHT